MDKLLEECNTSCEVTDVTEENGDSVQHTTMDTVTHDGVMACGNQNIHQEEDCKRLHVISSSGRDTETNTSGQAANMSQEQDQEFSMDVGELMLSPSQANTHCHFTRNQHSSLGLKRHPILFLNDVEEEDEISDEEDSETNFNLGQEGSISDEDDTKDIASAMASVSFNVSQTVRISPRRFSHDGVLDRTSSTSSLDISEESCLSVSPVERLVRGRAWGQPHATLLNEGLSMSGHLIQSKGLTRVMTSPVGQLMGQQDVPYGRRSRSSRSQSVPQEVMRRQLLQRDLAVQLREWGDSLNDQQRLKLGRDRSNSDIGRPEQNRNGFWQYVRNRLSPIP